jgi:hypothetical protein
LRIWNDAIDLYVLTFKVLSDFPFELRKLHYKKEFEELDELHYKTENELIQLIKSIHKKSKDGDWEDSLE